MRCVRSDRVVIRGAAAALAVLTAASPVASSFHEASVRHVACPEDGELIDAPAQAAHEHARVKGRGPSLFGERDSTRPETGGAAHGHCAIAVQAHLRAREPARVRVAVDRFATIAPASVPQERLALRRVALYRVAPKSSPPA